MSSVIRFLIVLKVKTKICMGYHQNKADLAKLRRSDVLPVGSVISGRR